ncbi:nucleoid-associated protein [Paenibacillus sp. KN14-4R]|uniref:nucleoid-associated protein n=1 Tax=Paenibacillus sp. KN14-4R TaxID=3445773 RepID=UPI003F9FF50D
MIDLSKVQIQDIVIHKVGNKVKDEGVVISKDVYEVPNDDIHQVLLKYFLNSFKFETFYKFSHEADLNLNEVYTYTNKIFNDRSSFHEQSVHLLRHLYEQSTHPQIKPGELYIVHFGNILYKDFPVNALGIFKSENKDVYLRVDEMEGSLFDVQSEQGINIKKLDKGCLIFNFKANEGFAVSIVDSVKKGNEEAAYWKDDFLRVNLLEDEHFLTDQYVRMCSNFYDDVIVATSEQTDKKDKLMFINQTIQYFAQHDEYVEEEFTEKVLQAPEHIQIFKTYKETYEEMNELPTVSQFPISHAALKKVKREFKNDIRLDTDIEIKVKNDNFDYLEKGYDEEKKMHYYKVYYNHEA